MVDGIKKCPVNKIEGITILFGSILIVFVILYGSIQTLGLEISYY